MFDVSFLEKSFSRKKHQNILQFLCNSEALLLPAACFQANTLDQNNHWLFLIRFSLGSVLEKRKINPALHSDPKKGKNYFSLKWELSVYFSHWKINCEVQTVQLKHFFLMFMTSLCEIVSKIVPNLTTFLYDKCKPL